MSFYILGLDTSAKAAGCAVYKNKLLLAESFANAGLTHSVTLMPMVRDMLANLGISVDDIDLFAVSAGPGSFTGLRIGIATTKALAMAANKPCAAISTLEALAYNILPFHGILVPAMDARRNQVYTAAFEGGIKPVRITEDGALSIPELGAQLKAYGKPAMLVGDGAELCCEALRETVPDLHIAPAHLLHQRAASVCAAAAHRADAPTQFQSAEALAPVYLRLPQAERERLERTQR